MNGPRPLEICEYSAETNPLKKFQDELDGHQGRYIYTYLERLKAKTVVVEPNYFDRDYLSELSAFYCISSKGYPNICKRIHVFSCEIDRGELELFLSEDEEQLKRIREAYIGFVVLRPIENSPLGRTVLSWYPDEQKNETPRNTEPSRNYVCHLGGVPLTVRGIAWQQQDTGVSACATVGVWTMMHSSAFDARHVIPTTAMITEAANRAGGWGTRPYPSAGLTEPQICEAIKEMGFFPSVSYGEVFPSQSEEVRMRAFSKERFANLMSAYIRSGYPVLVLGHYGDGFGHAICAVGFREVAPNGNGNQEGRLSLQDEDVQAFYIHDDNVGPNVRFEIESINEMRGNPVSDRCVLKMRAPEYVENPGELDAFQFFPSAIIVAVHDEIRISPDRFFDTAIDVASRLLRATNDLLEKANLPIVDFAISSRFIMIKDYLGRELRSHFQSNKQQLAKVRMSILEEVEPVSLHVAVLKIALKDGTNLVDVLYDTTDSDRNLRPFCSVVYDPALLVILNVLKEHNAKHFNFGRIIDGSQKAN